MKSYHNDNVIAQMSCRLVPPDASYPDCICQLVLTYRNLYVLEDEFNGAFTEHFILPCDSILQIELCTYLDDISPAEETAGTWQHVMTAVAGLIGGMIIFPSNSNMEKAPQRYLKISYEKQGIREEVYFNSIKGNPKRFIKQVKSFMRR